MKHQQIDRASPNAQKRRKHPQAQTNQAAGAFAFYRQRRHLMLK